MILANVTTQSQRNNHATHWTHSCAISEMLINWSCATEWKCYALCRYRRLNIMSSNKEQTKDASVLIQEGESRQVGRLVDMGSSFTHQRIEKCLCFKGFLSLFSSEKTDFWVGTGNARRHAYSIFIKSRYSIELRLKQRPYGRTDRRRSSFVSAQKQKPKHRSSSSPLASLCSLAELISLKYNSNRS